MRPSAQRNSAAIGVKMRSRDGRQKLAKILLPVRFRRFALCIVVLIFIAASVLSVAYGR